MKKGQKYINKDGVNKVVSPEEIQDYISQGWKLGNTNANTGGGRNTKGQRYFNNGVIEKKCFECPDGFVPGRLPFSKEHKEKIGTANKISQVGLKKSEEAKKRLSESLTGHKTSEETKIKISKALKGKPGHVLGKHWFTNGEIDVLRENCPEGFHPGHKPMSEDTRKKLSEILTGKRKDSSSGYLEKRKKTNLEKYGVEWSFFLGQKNGHKKDSSINLNFKTLLEENNIEYEREFRLGSYFYDFKVGNKLIELDPYATHNVDWNPFNNLPIDKNYHKNKTQFAIENGYQCIHIFDWDDCYKIINLLKPRKTVYARSCFVKEISFKESYEFLTKNHLQGSCRSKIKFGLFYDNQLVSVMTFGKPRYNIKYEWELLRYCSIYNVIGGAEKLFSYFVKTVNPSSVISYCDFAKFSGKVYTSLNFEKLSYSEPSKHWYNPKTNIHITDNLLRQRGFDQLFNEHYGKGTSNEELMLQNKFVEIYDCGQQSYKWENKC